MSTFLLNHCGWYNDIPMAIGLSVMGLNRRFASASVLVSFKTGHQPRILRAQLESNVKTSVFVWWVVRHFESVKKGLFESERKNILRLKCKLSLYGDIYGKSIIATLLRRKLWEVEIWCGMYRPITSKCRGGVELQLFH